MPSDDSGLEITTAGHYNVGNKVYIRLNHYSPYFRVLAVFTCGERQENRLHPTSSCQLWSSVIAVLWYGVQYVYMVLDKLLLGMIASPRYDQYLGFISDHSHPFAHTVFRESVRFFNATRLHSTLLNVFQNCLKSMTMN